jgi:hypothetical protein
LPPAAPRVRDAGGRRRGGGEGAGSWRQSRAMFA